MLEMADRSAVEVDERKEPVGSRGYLVGQVPSTFEAPSFRLPLAIKCCVPDFSRRRHGFYSELTREQVHH